MKMVYDDSEIKDIIAEFAAKAYGISDDAINSVTIDHRTQGMTGAVTYTVTVHVKTKDARPVADTYRTIEQKK